MQSWSGIGLASRVPETVRRRAWPLAERLIQCERFLDGGAGRVLASMKDAAKRCVDLNFSEADTRGLKRLVATLGSGAASERWGRGDHATLKQRLAAIIGCEP